MANVFPSAGFRIIPVLLIVFCFFCLPYGAADESLTLPDMGGKSLSVPDQSDPVVTLPGQPAEEGADSQIMDFPMEADGQMTDNESDFDRPLMHFTPEEMEEFQAYRATQPLAALYEGDTLPKGSHSFLQAIPYLGDDRDQGHCGNCWVWASTGAMEVSHTMSSNISDRLSIQYFNSNWGNSSTGKNACNGGWPFQVAEFYTNVLKQTIPWSNTNASYADYFWKPGNESGMPASSIATSPAYPLEYVSDIRIDTSVGTESIVNTIKKNLNENIPVVYCFWLPDAGWQEFYSFWDNQTDTALWNPDQYVGQEMGGGHAVLIVGYNDTTEHPYWEILNSWGNNTGRPDGTYRLDMNMNYSAMMFENGTAYNSNTFDIFSTFYQPPEPEIGTLDIRSYPDQAEIWIDGKKTGEKTPKTFTGMAAGYHQVSLKKKEYTEYTRAYPVYHEQTTRVAATLLPIKNAGTLEIFSVPSGADIILDGVDTGLKTPKTMAGIIAGDHSLLLRKEKYDDWSGDITLSTGEKMVVSAELTI